MERGRDIVELEVKTGRKATWLYNETLEHPLCYEVCHVREDLGR